MDHTIGYKYLAPSHKCMSRYLIKKTMEIHQLGTCDHKCLMTNKNTKKRDQANLANRFII